MTADDTAVLAWLIVIFGTIFAFIAVYAAYQLCVAAAWGRAAASARAAEHSWKAARRRHDEEGPQA